MSMIRTIAAPTWIEAKRQQLRDRAVAVDYDCDEDFVSMVRMDRVVIVAARSAVPHVDSEFPEWTALWVLQGQHRLWTANHKPRGANDYTRKPLRSPGLTSVDLSPGDIVVFNVHRTHWMDAAPDGSLMLAGSFDFKAEPSDADVVARIEEEVA